MTDYKKVAETLRRCKRHDGESHEAAIALCERMAKGELVERSEHCLGCDGKGVQWLIKDGSGYHNLCVVCGGSGR